MQYNARQLCEIDKNRLIIKREEKEHNICG